MISFPVLSVMSKKKDVEVHSDITGSYKLVVRKGCGLVAIMSSKLCPANGLSDPVFFNELKKIEEYAVNSNVSANNVVMLICSNPESLTTRIRDAMSFLSMDRFRAGVVWSEIDNRKGIQLTDDFIDKVWGKSRVEFAGFSESAC
jgi:hypothetical protein